jgi:hypothetical protein
MGIEIRSHDEPSVLCAVQSWCRPCRALHLELYDEPTAETWTRSAAGQERGTESPEPGSRDEDTFTPTGSMVFTVMAALAQMELEIKRERVTDSVATRRAVSALGIMGR